MVKRHSIHLGYVFVDFLAHQDLHVHLSTIFAKPYLTRLMQGMGILECPECLEYVSILALLVI